MNKPLIILTGPTAVGKTELSIALAKALNGAIISADSMQVYKKMNIGTAKIMPEEMQGVPHYLVDELDPKEEFHVVRFKEMAKKALEEIYANGQVPIVVGGTGFYVQALLYDIDFEETKKDQSFRLECEAFVKEHGQTALHDRLAQVDIESAKAIHENNVRRVIRALEYYHETGQPISAHNEEQKQKESPYHAFYFVLNMERKKLYERIDLRIDQMMEQGLLEEVKGLLEQGYSRELVSMQGLGYKEFFDYFDGHCSLEEAISILKRDTRHFAKRQLTWFRREKEVIWVDKDQFSNEKEILSYILETIRKEESHDTL